MDVIGGCSEVKARKKVKERSEMRLEWGDSGGVIGAL